MKNFLRLPRLFLLGILGVILAGAAINLNSLENYAAQNIPNYITKDNTPPNNAISDAGATLGRVMFYDKMLSLDFSTSCSSCHLQSHAFGDTAVASVGMNGTTGRHSMRLVNARFGIETRAFWDERAISFEDQATQPIQDHTEMGFSDTLGNPAIDSLIRRMEATDYYPRLFDFVFGDSVINETRMQFAIAQFVRSIQSFDSKFDVGLMMTNNLPAPFPNFTVSENAGKQLFTTPPNFDNQGIRTGGGAGCIGCHGTPEFDINPGTGNNGVVEKIGGGIDITNTKAPSLRDLFNPSGDLNGPLMHNGAFTSFEQVLDHYDSIPDVPGNTNLDFRLRPGGNFQQLRLTAQERQQLNDFVRTLTGVEVYTHPKWSDPFIGDSLDIEWLMVSIDEMAVPAVFSVFPNPSRGQVKLVASPDLQQEKLQILDVSGKVVYAGQFQQDWDFSNWNRGMYFLRAGGRTVRMVLQ